MTKPTNLDYFIAIGQVDLEWSKFVSEYRVALENPKHTLHELARVTFMDEEPRLSAHVAFRLLVRAHYSEADSFRAVAEEYLSSAVARALNEVFKTLEDAGQSNLLNQGLPSEMMASASALRAAEEKHLAEANSVRGKGPRNRRTELQLLVEDSMRAAIRSGRSFCEWEKGQFGPNPAGDFELALVGNTYSISRFGKELARKRSTLETDWWANAHRPAPIQ